MLNVRRIPSARSTLVACGIALLWAAGTALADEPTQGTRPAPTKEQRESMAQVHDKIAACLRSDKPIEECHAMMMQSHEGMMRGRARMGQPTTPPAQN
jgi:hypothetical protein